MKKTMTIATVLFVGIFFLSSCSEKDEIDNSLTSKSIIGRWQLEKVIKSDGTPKELSEAQKKRIFEFRSNGTFASTFYEKKLDGTFTSGEEDMTGTWKIKESKLEMVFKDSDKIFKVPNPIVDKKLTLPIGRNEKWTFKVIN